MIVAALAVCSTLTLIGMVHVYWAMGGSRAKAGAVPSKQSKPVFSPGPFATALVGVALFGMAILVASAGRLITPVLPAPLLRASTALLALVFAARAIGDFRYVGFFKRIKGSVFARRDTTLYAPLCLLLAILIACIAIG